MRRMVVALAVISALAGVASAQRIGEPNALVVYFDEAATQRSWYGTGPVTAYIVAGPLEQMDVWPAVPYTGLEWWLAELELVPASHVADVVVRARGDAAPLQYALEPSWWPQLTFTLQTPLPLAGLTVIADLEMLVLSDQPTEIHLRGGPFIADGRQDAFAMLTHGSDGPMDVTDHVANLNAEAPVPVEAMTWGGLKALFD